MSQRIKDEIAKFPKEFGLRGHKGRFTLSERSSYESGTTVWLYTQDEKGQDFCKGTPSELRREVTA
jgi:hypothetical protein